MNIEDEIRALKERVLHLELEIQLLTFEKSVAEMPAIYVTPSAKISKSVTNKELLKWMQAEGVYRQPTKAELGLSAEWEALPSEEKEEVLRELNHLPPGSTASDIIAENRS